MTDRRKQNKGDKKLHQLKFVVGCTLIGSVVTGAFFGWVPTEFDIRIVGAGLGALAGVAAGHLA